MEQVSFVAAGQTLLTLIKTLLALELPSPEEEEGTE